MDCGGCEEKSLTAGQHIGAVHKVVNKVRLPTIMTAPPLRRISAALPLRRTQDVVNRSDWSLRHPPAALPCPVSRVRASVRLSDKGASLVARSETCRELEGNSLGTKKAISVKGLGGGGQGEGGGLHGATPATPPPTPRAGGRCASRCRRRVPSVGRNCGRTLALTSECSQRELHATCETATIIAEQAATAQLLGVAHHFHEEWNTRIRMLGSGASGA